MAMELLHLTKMWKAVVEASNNDNGNETCTELQTSNDGHLSLILLMNALIALVRLVDIGVLYAERGKICTCLYVFAF